MVWFYSRPHSPHVMPDSSDRAVTLLSSSPTKSDRRRGNCSISQHRMNSCQHVTKQVIVIVRYLLHLWVIKMINDLLQNDDMCHIVLPEQSLVVDGYAGS